MTLDEVINYNRLLADMEYKSGDLEVAEYYLNTAKGLEELKELREQKAEYKRLLKAAVEDMGVTVAKVYNGGLICECCKWKSQTGECCCSDDGSCDVAYRWRHADEALKLIES